MHPDTRRTLELLLHMLTDEGEQKTFAYIKSNLKNWERIIDSYI